VAALACMPLLRFRPGPAETRAPVPFDSRLRRSLMAGHYVARPPVATKRLTRLSDGRLMNELRHPWRDGTTHVAFLPLELMEKLAALVPPSLLNLVRYHGVLAPAARHRADVVPGVEKSEDLERLEKNADSPEMPGPHARIDYHTFPGGDSGDP